MPAERGAVISCSLLAIILLMCVVFALYEDLYATYMAYMQLEIHHDDPRSI